MKFQFNKNKFYFPISLLIVIGCFLSACGGCQKTDLSQKESNKETGSSLIPDNKDSGEIENKEEEPLEKKFELPIEPIPEAIKGKTQRKLGFVFGGQTMDEVCSRKGALKGLSIFPQKGDEVLGEEDMDLTNASSFSIVNCMEKKSLDFYETECGYYGGHCELSEVFFEGGNRLEVLIKGTLNNGPGFESKEQSVRIDTFLIKEDGNFSKNSFSTVEPNGLGEKEAFEKIEAYRKFWKKKNLAEDKRVEFERNIFAIANLNHDLREKAREVLKLVKAKDENFFYNLTGKFEVSDFLKYPY